MRGRVDHGDKGTSLVVQTVEPFQPSAEEVEEAREAAARAPVGPQPLLVTLDAARLPASIIDELKHVFGNHAGESRGRARHPHVRAASARCAWARATASRRRRACAPSSSTSSARPRCRPADGGVAKRAKRRSRTAGTGRGAADRPLGEPARIGFGLDARRAPPRLAARNRANPLGSVCGPSLYRWTGGGGPHSGPGARGALLGAYPRPWHPHADAAPALSGRTPRSDRARDGAGPAAAAQRARELDLLGRRAAVVLPGVSSTHGRPSKRGSDRNDRAAVGAELALADVGVAVAVGAQRRLRVVEVQRAEAAQADRRRRTRRARRASASARADVVARGEQVAGVEADAEALVAAGGVEQRGQLVERAPERAARARRCSRGAAGSARSRASASRDDLAGALDRRRDLARLAPSRRAARPRAAPSASPARSEAISDVRVLSRISVSVGGAR